MGDTPSRIFSINFFSSPPPDCMSYTQGVLVWSPFSPHKARGIPSFLRGEEPPDYRLLPLSSFLTGGFFPRGPSPFKARPGIPLVAPSGDSLKPPTQF